MPERSRAGLWIEGQGPRPRVATHAFLPRKSTTGEGFSPSLFLTLISVAAPRGALPGFGGLPGLRLGSRACQAFKRAQARQT